MAEIPASAHEYARRVRLLHEERNYAVRRQNRVLLILHSFADEEGVHVPGHLPSEPAVDDAAGAECADVDG